MLTVIRIFSDISLEKHNRSCLCEVGETSVIGVELLFLVVALFIYTQDLGTEDKAYKLTRTCNLSYDLILY